MKKEELVSIVVPVYNAEKFLKETIQTVLDQTYSNWELLLVDDCSSDDSANIIEEYVTKDDRIRLLRNERNSGAALTRNHGIKEARGTYLCFLDADDLWEKEKIENDGELDEIRKSLYSDKGLLIIGDTIYKVKGEYIYKVPTSSESILSEIDETPEKFKDIRFRHTIQMTASISETHNTPRIVYEDAVIQGGGEARTPLFKVNSKRREHIKFIAEIQVDNKWCYLKFGLRGRAQKKKIGIWGNTFNDEMVFGEGYGVVTVNNTTIQDNIIAPRVDNQKESYSTSLGKYSIGPNGQIRSCTINAYFYCCKRQEFGVHYYQAKFNVNN